MRLGIHLPQYGRAASPEAIRSVAERAEQLGFADVWVSDHLVQPAAQTYPSAYLFDPLLTLTWAAAATSRIGLGTSVLVVPQYHPLHLANSLASLDRLSGGRLTVVAGAGWSAGEFAALGQDFANRGARFDEALTVMRTAWTDDPASFHGEHYEFDDIRVLPPPAHPIPIWIGGGSPPAHRRAVARGDGFQAISTPPDVLAPIIADIRSRVAAERPEASFVVSYRTGWDPQGMDPTQIRDECAAYTAAGVDHVLSAPWRTNASDWIRSMELLVEIVEPETGLKRPARREPTMQYRTLGRTGVTVSSQCLGAMMFGAIGNTDHDECVAMIHTALDAGINFIDTADVYSRGESEEIVGRALAGRRDDVVLATKCFMPMGKDPNRSGASRRWIVQALEDSLRRLGTDHIDVYQMHRFDWTVDLDDTLGALTDLVRSGKVRYIGSSTYPAECIVEAQWASARRQRERFVCEQPQYSIFARSVESAVLPTCQRHGMGVIPWSPLAGGWLTGKYRAGAEVPAGSRYAAGSMWNRMGGGRGDDDGRYALIEQLAPVADAAGLTMTQLALGFVDAHPAVTAPIIGVRTPEQLTAALAAADIVLDADTLDAIDTVCPPGTDAPNIGHGLTNPALEPAARRR